MKRNEKILAGVLLVVVVGYFAGPSLLGLLTGSGERLQAEKLQLTRELKQLKKLNAWKHQSLAAPTDDNAHRAEEQYRDWVWSLAESVGQFQELNVTPNSRGGSRRGRSYAPVQVQLTAVAKFGDVRRFLYHFYQADLLHKVVSLRMKSKSQDADPDLDILLVAEGLSLEYAADELSVRDSLFPRARLAGDADDDKMSVVGGEEFPRQGEFLVRVGSQFLAVSGAKIDEDDSTAEWTFEPHGEAGRLTGDLESDDTAELVRVAKSMEKTRLDDYKLINPFARYDEAQLIVYGEKTITLGDAFSLTAKVSEGRPGAKASFEMTGQPDGMVIDKETGKITWQTTRDQQPGKATLQVVARIAGQVTPVTGSPTSLEWRAAPIPVVKNESPLLGQLKPVQTVAGSPVEFTVSATDPEKGRLSFALASGSPSDATIDAKTGQFRWTPANPGEFKVKVEVSDDGAPRAKATGVVSITVMLDSAQFTVLTASVRKDGRSEAWLFDRLKNQRIVLVEQAELRYGDVAARVEKIESRSVLFRIGENDVKLSLGESIQKLKPATSRPYDSDPMSATEKPATEKPATEKPATEKSGR